MDFFELECPRCNASLEIEDGLDTFFCKYCGARLVVEGISDGSLNARVRLKELEHEERMRNADYDFERFRIAQESNEKRVEFKRSLLVIGLLVLMIVAILGGVTISHMVAVSQLEHLESEIKDDIEAGDYDAAMIKTNDLVLRDNYSRDEERSWREKREMYVNIIAEKRREVGAANPDNRYAPRDSTDFGELTGDEAKELFAAAGFTNIELVQVAGNAGWFKRANLVEHINFGGKANFSVEDYCNKDDKIIIYYYSE